jgi:hypothetical protein
MRGWTTHFVLSLSHVFHPHSVDGLSTVMFYFNIIITFTHYNILIYYAWYHMNTPAGH